MKFTKNDEAVSPVIGVILMVAITVILAAVIAAFVFGMAGNISKTKVVAATVQQPAGDTIVVTYQGGQDAPTLHNLTVSINDAMTGPDTVGSLNEDTTDNSILGVGASGTFTGSFGGRDHVVVMGHFTDGSTQVIVDNFV